MRRTVVRYGHHRSNIAELWRPDRVDGSLGVVVLLHGGFWRARYTKRLMRGLAGAVTDEGWAAWNVEYRRVGRGGGGGGWPATFADVAAAIDVIARIPGLDDRRVVTCGHSAGGHLALWAAARARLPVGAPGGAPAVTPRAAVALAGIGDLRRAADAGLGNGAVTALMGTATDGGDDRWRWGSPAALAPLGVEQILLHGTADTTVPPSHSERYVADARAAGEREISYVPVDGVDHMGLIRTRSAASPVLRTTLRRLLG